MTATNHDGHSNENVKNQQRIFKKSPNSWRIHSHTVFRKQVCSHCGCGRRGHCGRHCRTPFQAAALNDRGNLCSNLFSFIVPNNMSSFVYC